MIASELRWVFKRSCALGKALLIAMWIMLVCPVGGDIIVDPGPSTPAYPAAMPDPWVIPGDLDLNGSSLTVNNGSALDIGGSLWLNDTPIVGSISPVFSFDNATINVGVDALLGYALTPNPDPGILNLTATDSTIMVGGDFDATLGAVSASELNWDNVTFTGGGDFIFAGTGSDADNSAASLVITDSSLAADGSFRSVLGNNSVQNQELTNTTLDLGGDLLTEIGGTGPDAGGSTQTVSWDNVNITADNLTHRVRGDNSSHSLAMEMTSLDLGGNFLIETPGDNSDMTVSMDGISGSVGSDFTIRGTGADSVSTVVINDFDVAVDGSIVFDLPSTNDSSATLFIDQFKSTVGGDVIFDMPTDATGTRTLTIGAFDVTFVGDVTTHNLTLEDATLSDAAGGDFRIDTVGEAQTVRVSLTDISGGVGNDLVIRADGSDNTIDANFANTTLDIANNFIIEASDGDSDVPATFGNPGPGADTYNNRVSLTANGINVNVGGDLAFRAGGNGSSNSVVLTNSTIDVGGNLEFQGTQPGTFDNDTTMLFTGSTFTVGNDAIFTSQVGPSVAKSSDSFFTMLGTDIQAGRDITFDFSNVESPTNPRPVVDRVDTVLGLAGVVLNADRDILLSLPGGSGQWDGDSDPASRQPELQTFDGTLVNMDWQAGREIRIEAGTVTADAGSWNFAASDHTFNAPTTTIAVPSIEYSGELNVVGDIAFTNSAANPGLSFSFEDGIFDIDGDFAIQTPGMDAALTVVGTETTIDAAGDITFAGGGDGSSSVFSLNDTTLTSTGGDVRLSLFESGAENADGSTIITSSDMTAANNIVIAHDGGANSTAVHSATNTTFDAGNDIVFDYANDAGASNASTFTTLGFTTLDAGRDIIVDLTGSDADRESQFSWATSTLTAGRSITLSAEAVNDASNYTVALFDVNFNAPTVNLDMPLTLYDEIDVDGDLVVSNTAGGVIPVLTSRYETDAGFAFDRMTVTGSADIQGGGLGLVPMDDATPDPAIGQSALVIAADGGATGAFDTVESPDFGDSTTLAVTYEPDGVRATRTYYGDATVNGGVGLKDFIITAHNQATQGTWQDGNFANGLGTIGADDLDLVVNHFGLGERDMPDVQSDQVRLMVDLQDGGLALAGNVTLRGFAIHSSSGSLTPGVGLFEDEFDTTLQSDAEAIAYGDRGDGVLLDGEIDLASSYQGEGIADLMLVFGLVDEMELFEGPVTFVSLDPAAYSAAPPMIFENISRLNATLSSHLAARRRGLPQTIAASPDQTGYGSMLASAQHDPMLIAAALDQRSDEPMANSQTGRATDDQGFNVIFQGIGIFENQKHGSDIQGYRADSGGALIGADLRLMKNLDVGLSFSYLRSDLSLKGGRGSQDIDAFRVGPYLSYSPEPWFIDASLIYGYHRFDTDRRDPLAGTRTTSEHDGHELSAYLGAGWQIELTDQTQLIPVASLLYTHLHEGSTRESGPGALRIKSRNADSLRSRIGLQMEHIHDAGEMIFIFEAALGWEHEWLSQNHRLSATVAAGGPATSIRAGQPDDHAAFLGTGMTVLFSDSVSAFVRYDGLYAGDGSSHGIAAGLTFRY